MNKSSNINQKKGLYDPSFEHDSCGVGFIADIKGRKSHKIIRDGVKILESLAHRGAYGSDPLTGDGAGMMIQIPDLFLRNKCKKINIDLPQEGFYGVGFVFLPTIWEERNLVESWFEKIVNQEGQEFLGWRHVPHDSSQIGEVARTVEPELKQVFIALGRKTKPEDFEKKLFIIRKQIWRKVVSSELYQKNFFYVCSLSSKTLVYKGQLLPNQLDRFYPDLTDPDMTSAIAMIHSRYSTNTFPTWALAHPYRMIAHNGEINALRGNVNWSHARETSMESKVFGKDIKKILPVIAPNKSDSASFDNVVEMLVMNGRPIPLAMMMMIPEAWSGDPNMSEEKKSFYKYHSCIMEPWDGPAAITFSDGRYVGAILDRNGLRPLRYWIMNDDTVVMASETGVLPIEPQDVLKKDLMQPGKMFLIDTHEGRIIDDEELKHEFSKKRPYSKWLKDNLIDLSLMREPEIVPGLNEKTLVERQKIFGYTLEDFKFHILPMAENGEEAVGSMGNDTPLAVLSSKPKLLYSYFKQLFAQVTNPPIDSIREEIIMSSDLMLGSEGNLLIETPENSHRIWIKHAIINNSDLEKIKIAGAEDIKTKTLKTFFDINDGIDGLEKAMDRLFRQANSAIEEGYSILILSDRDASQEKVPIPALLSCSGLHQHLVRNGTRTKVSLVVETGEAREMHHYATLLGFGAEAINPYLVFETIENEIKMGNLPKGINYKTAEKNYIKATRKGLFKIIAKMGISTLQSYCGAQIFEAVGLGEELIQKYFTATPSRIGGIEIDTLAEELLKRHESAFCENNIYDMFDSGGDYQWRLNGEHHQINPEMISLLQQAVRTNDYNLYKKYSAYVNDPNKNLANIRNLLRFKKNYPIPLDEVEPASEIVKRFATGAMSYGSISKEAHETLAIAMNRLGGFSNTGEGGEDPERFKKEENGDWKRSRIKQIAPGRFGVTIEYLVNADQLQIKMAQGAKPGEGGQLPGHKVSKDIAKTRHTIAGVGLISPPPHHDIYSIEDLKQLIHDLKNANPQADISVKLVSEVGVGTIAAGVSKAKADHVVISGGEGGTGASPQTSIKHAGLPLELGIAEAQQVLLMNDLRGRIRVQADGQLKTGRDIVVVGMLGADEFGFATTALVSMGCVMLRNCHQNTCSVGIATQDEKLRANFAGKPEHVVNFFMFIAEEVREIMAMLGFKRFDDLVGRVDFLEVDDVIDHWKAKGLDLTHILHKSDVPIYMPLRHVEKQIHDLDWALDRKLIKYSQNALDYKTPVKFSSPIKNTNLTVGTMLSSEIAKRYGLEGLPKDTITVELNGSAGQSFGAFLACGVTLKLEGDANDYVGKGLSGGKLIIYPPAKSTFAPEHNVIVGNVALYGAVIGEAYIRGLAGERFAVRNSGAYTVVEGVGDNGCEYMTGGRVVILGKTGRNFAAGMSGGIAYVWDKDGNFNSKCNLNMVNLFPICEDDDIEMFFEMVENHAVYTNSTVAKYVLAKWQDIKHQFVKVYPIEYQKALEENLKLQAV